MKPIPTPPSQNWNPDELPVCVVQHETRAQRRASILAAEARLAESHHWYSAGNVLEDVDGNPLSAEGYPGYSVESVTEDLLYAVDLAPQDVPHHAVLPPIRPHVYRRWPEDMAYEDE